VIVLDASAVIAFLRDEPAAAEVEALLRDGRATLTAAGLAEVVDHLVRVAGQAEELALADLAQLDLLDAIPVDVAIGVHAGRVRARRYHHRRAAVSLADCLGLAAARARGAALATTDPHLLDVCLAEGVAHVALPRSDGSRWTGPPIG
jgi:ribonuclease VapC